LKKTKSIFFSVFTYHIMISAGATASIYSPKRSYKHSCSSKPESPFQPAQKFMQTII